MGGREHETDMHGYLEILMALMHLLPHSVSTFSNRGDEYTPGSIVGRDLEIVYLLIELMYSAGRSR